MRDPKVVLPPWSDMLAYKIKQEEAKSSYDLTTTSQASSSRERWNPIDDNYDHNSNMPVSNCEVVSSSAQNLALLRTMPSTGFLLLLTPIVVPATATSSRSRDDPVDPFEAFGNALSTFHARVRHVPYVPSIGLSKTHVAFIERAAAIVIVMCPPAVRRHESMDAQEAFVHDVIKDRTRTDRSGSVSCSVVEFGDAGLSSRHTLPCGTVLKARDVSSKAFASVARTLFAS